MPTSYHLIHPKSSRPSHSDLAPDDGVTIVGSLRGGANTQNCQPHAVLGTMQPTSHQSSSGRPRARASLNGRRGCAGSSRPATRSAGLNARSLDVSWLDAEPSLAAKEWDSELIEYATNSVELPGHSGMPDSPGAEVASQAPCRLNTEPPSQRLVYAAVA